MSFDYEAFWSARYRDAGDDYLFGTAPNKFLAAQSEYFGAGMNVLSVADGEGRNSVWLAEQGCTVTVSYTHLDVYKRQTRNGGDAAQITPLTRLEDGLYTQELSNGPTLAFKDMAMQLLGNLFEYVLDKRGESINILGATSGDTGSSAEYAMRGKQGVRVFMLSPHERCV